MPSGQWELAVRSEAASLNRIMYMILFLLERGAAGPQQQAQNNASYSEMSAQPNGDGRGPSCREQWLRGVESLEQQRIDVARPNFTWPSGPHGHWENMVYLRSGVKAIGRRPSGRRVLFIHIGKAGGTTAGKFLSAARISHDEVHGNAVLPEVAPVRVRAYT